MKVNLRLLRAERDLSIRAVAKETGLSINTVRSQEKDENQGYNETRNALYRYYGYELVPRKLED